MGLTPYQKDKCYSFSPLVEMQEGSLRFLTQQGLNMILDYRMTTLLAAVMVEAKKYHSGE